MMTRHHAEIPAEYAGLKIPSLPMKRRWTRRDALRNELRQLSW